MTASVFSRLLRWYRRHGRNLPWRQTRDPYKILVSEVMLQQTQVERVKLYYAAWLKQFPDWSALARASNAEVIRAWAGLGYNRRALSLRDIARTVVADGLPASQSGWLQLKGIGPYTSAAIAAFALHEKTMPIDTNIRRVLGRLWLGKPYPQPASDVQIQQRSLLQLASVRAHYDVPQALFDLATAVCKKIPDCASCPLKQQCQAAPKFLSGSVRVPKAMIRKSTERKHRNKPYPDRIYRGRILAAVRESGHGLRQQQLGSIIDPAFDAVQDASWLAAMVKRLEADGLLRKKGNLWQLG